jgi:hypothetical protein
VGAHDVVVREGEAVAKAVVNVSLRSKVDDCVYLLFPQHVGHKIAGADVAFDELHRQTQQVRKHQSQHSLRHSTTHQDTALNCCTPVSLQKPAHLVIPVPVNLLQVV